MKQYVESGKKQFKKLWETDYKDEDPFSRATLSPESAGARPPPARSIMDDIIAKAAPNRRPANTTHSSRRDQYWQYCQEPTIDHLSALQYWRAKETQWPQLTSMALDFLAIPAMSSECERVFSSCAKQTTPESSSLSGELLWHQECLKNWQNRGAVEIAGAFKGVLLDV